jgi:hypothetical protein
MQRPPVNQNQGEAKPKSIDLVLLLFFLKYKVDSIYAATATMAARINVLPIL